MDWSSIKLCLFSFIGLPCGIYDYWVGVEWLGAYIGDPGVQGLGEFMRLAIHLAPNMIAHWYSLL